MPQIKFVKISELKNDPQNVLVGLKEAAPRSLYMSKLINLLDTLKDDLIIAVEDEYVDYTYRDAYYYFYATKYHDYSRYCVKLSLFEKDIVENGFVNLHSGNINFSFSDQIISKYLGFIILRPLSAVLGRNVISPWAKRDQERDIAVCQTTFKTSALGLKMETKGFPHASQDGEVMTCAETTIWSIVEYFGNRYPIFSPALPSDIREALKNATHERQWPSEGLNFLMISSSLKNLGFNPKVYLLQKTNSLGDPIGLMDDDIRETLVACIESGLPIVLCLQNKKIGHAICAMGVVNTGFIPNREVYWKDKDGNLINDKTTGHPKKLRSYNLSLETIVVNDDNVPAYKKTSIENPAHYYTVGPDGDNDWDGVRITKYIVPLPERVHMYPSIAVEYSKKLLFNNTSDNLIYRTYLASSRSFRDHLMNSKILSNENKNILLQLNIPRFIWVTEFENDDEFNNGITTGILILDATESNQNISSVVVYIDKICNFAYFKERNCLDRLPLANLFQMEFYNKNLFNYKD